MNKHFEDVWHDGERVAALQKPELSEVYSLLHEDLTKLETNPEWKESQAILGRIMLGLCSITKFQKNETSKDLELNSWTALENETDNVMSKILDSE